MNRREFVGKAAASVAVGVAGVAALAAVSPAPTAASTWRKKVVRLERRVFGDEHLWVPVSESAVTSVMVKSGDLI